MGGAVGVLAGDRERVGSRRLRASRLAHEWNSQRDAVGLMV